ncbi:Rv3235 family protein [Klenkia sp. LSe6-5]|uniref:Rv3235 family protein n=1 Tax=Klenkia sesuvii TaxID=3103137 RepID=A0ABU8DTU7_9ACTN
MSTPAPSTTSPAVDPQGQRPVRAQLRLVPTPGPGTPPVPVTRLVLRGVPAPRPVALPGPRPGTGGRAGTPPLGPRGVDRRWGALPDPAPLAHRLLVSTLEAFCGLRPVAQLRSAYTLPVFTALTRGRRPAWTSTGTSPVLVGPVRVAEPVEGVAEVCAVARRDGRAHAVAARLEVIDGRWRCTALQVG